MASNAPYVYKGGKWVDCNNELLIRDNDSTNSPTSKNVPKVNAYYSGKWNQIYPPTEQSGGGTSVSGKLTFWQGTPSEIASSGWGGWENHATTDVCAQGYFGTGTQSNERRVWKCYAGWTGMTRDYLISKGYKGLGSVTNVRKVTVTVTWSAGTGAPGYNRKLGLVATKVKSPFDSPPPNDSDANNPIVSSNRSAVMLSNEAHNFTSGHTKVFTFTSATHMGIFKDFLNGNKSYKNLISYNGDTHDSGNIYQAGGYYFSKFYMKMRSISFVFDYDYEP